MDISQALQEITTYINKNGGLFYQWYVGITSDIEQRLFNGHSVDRYANIWIYRSLISSDEARRLEAYFLSQGCRGDVGGGDKNANFIYCYQMTQNTRE